MRGKAKRLTTEDTGEHRGKFYRVSQKPHPVAKCGTRMGHLLDLHLLIYTLQLTLTCGR